MTELEPTRQALQSALADLSRPLTPSEAGALLNRDTPSMTVSDAAAVLANAAAMDNRHIDEAQAVEWSYALAGLTPQECVTAIRRYRQETHPTPRGEEYLTAGRVRELVMQLRQERFLAARVADARAVVAAGESADAEGQAAYRSAVLLVQAVDDRAARAAAAARQGDPVPHSSRPAWEA